MNKRKKESQQIPSSPVHLTDPEARETGDMLENRKQGTDQSESALFAVTAAHAPGGLWFTMDPIYSESKEAFLAALSKLDDVAHREDEIFAPDVAAALNVPLDFATGMFGLDPEEIWSREFVLLRLRREFQAAYPEEYSRPLEPPCIFDESSKENEFICEELSEWIKTLVQFERFTAAQVARIYNFSPKAAHDYAVEWLDARKDGSVSRIDVYYDFSH